MSFDEEYRDEHDECRHEIESLRAQLLATQAHVARLVEALENSDTLLRKLPDSGGFYGLAVMEENASALSALSAPINLDALHEALARECERLKNGFPQRSPLDTEAWLDREASAHRAKNEAK